MSVRVTLRQLQEQLPDLLERAVERGEPCVVERNGEDYAVIVSAREWGQRIEADRDADRPSAWAREQDEQLRTIGSALDAQGPDYRLGPEKQSRAEALLAKKDHSPLT